MYRCEVLERRVDWEVRQRVVGEVVVVDKDQRYANALVEVII